MTNERTKSAITEAISALYKLTIKGAVTEERADAARALAESIFHLWKDGVPLPVDVLDQLFREVRSPEDEPGKGGLGRSLAGKWACGKKAEVYRVLSTKQPLLAASLAIRVAIHLAPCSPLSREVVLRFAYDLAEMRHSDLPA